MKKFLLTLCIASGMIFSANAQQNREITVNTTVSEVTVFLQGAQVTRTTNQNIPAGRSTLRFGGLSPYIDARSVQVRVDGEVMVLAVNHRLNHGDTVRLNDEVERYRRRIAEINEAVRLAQVELAIVNQRIEFLNANRAISGSERGIDHNNLRQTAEFHTQQITALLRSQAEINQRIATLNQERTAVNRLISSAGNITPQPTGEILVQVDARTARTRVPIEISYHVANASWFPSYDIRARDISQPIQLVYRANVIQNTREDWNNVRLRISSANPNLGNVAPRLQPWFMDFNVPPPRHDLATANLSNTVSGVVTDERGEPLIGVNVLIRGTSIGTVTNVDGRYSLTIPAGGGELVFSFMGMQQETRRITGATMNVRMREDDAVLSEVVVTGMGVQRSMRSETVPSVVIAEDISPARRTPAPQERAVPIPVAQVEAITSVEFEIETPYTIPSRNEVTVVEMAHFSLPAEFEYFAIPKIDRDAFLLAHIVGWEQYNLLAGEANIFFENTFVGTTILDTRQLTDTLTISLGRDRNVVVRREPVREFMQTRFLSARTEVTRNWRTTVRNNKNQPIRMTILDQIPVSINNDIEVTHDRIQNGTLNRETGEVRWQFTLEPGERTELDLLYRVRHPRGRNVIVE